MSTDLCRLLRSLQYDRDSEVIVVGGIFVERMITNVCILLAVLLNTFIVSAQRRIEFDCNSVNVEIVILTASYHASFWQTEVVAVGSCASRRVWVRHPQRNSPDRRNAAVSFQARPAHLILRSDKYISTVLPE